MRKPILKRPVSNEFKISQAFWVDHAGDPEYDWAYQVFDAHHPGVDFYMPKGSGIYNVFEGVVVRQEWHKGMGEVVGVRNGNIVAIYAHLGESLVKAGEVVPSGELIAKSGNTGVATKPDTPHLHFELRDLTRPQLKEMVFKPEFGKPMKRWRETFTYKINNTNTRKTWRFLALRYFGGESAWKKIMRENGNVSIKGGDTVLPDRIEIVIPNYK